MTLALVAVLGGLGAAVRFMVDGLIRARGSWAFPVATVTVNVTGSLLVGILTGAHLFHGFGPPLFTAATTGFCGGYTTFSTAMMETVRLIQAGDIRRALANVLVTLASCLAAAGSGVALMQFTAG